jgi:hypothetical protein
MTCSVLKDLTVWVGLAHGIRRELSVSLSSLLRRQRSKRLAHWRTGELLSLKRDPFVAPTKEMKGGWFGSARFPEYYGESTV